MTEQPVGLDGLLDVKTYQVVMFALTIERSSTFFNYVFIAPSVLLIVLTLCLYWIPVQSGERFTLGWLTFKLSLAIHNATLYAKKVHLFIFRITL